MAKPGNPWSREWPEVAGRDNKGQRVARSGEKWFYDEEKFALPSDYSFILSEIQVHHSKALTTHYNRVNCCFGILILKEDNQQ